MKKPTGRPILAVDVDLTVVDSGTDWLSYLEYHSGFQRPLIEEGQTLPYDLSELFPRVADPYQYWRELDYDQFEPIEGAVEKLTELSKHLDIVFVTAIKGNHSKNKFYWLEKWFPFNRGYVATQEKWTMNKSVVGMIDDRLNNLEGFDLFRRILYNTPYSQGKNEFLEVGYVIKDWKSLDVRDLFKYLVWK